MERPYADPTAAVRELLDDGVRAGRFGPGTKLPTERALAVDLGISRAAVRTALGSLEREGMITRHVGRGTFLTSGSAVDRTEAGLQTSPAEIMATRLVLEPEVAAIAAQHATPEDLHGIHRCLQRAESAATYVEFELWDAAFHEQIARATHNRLLIRLFATVNTARKSPVWGSIKQRSSSPERRAGYEADHGRIVEALVERDSEEARHRMRLHLANVRENLLGPSGAT